MYDIRHLNCINMTDQFVSIDGVIRIDRLALRLVNGVLSVIMWLLSATVLCGSIVWLFVRHEDAFTAFTSVAASLLFALPSVSRLLPAAPQSSTEYEYVNIYAQLTVVAIALILQ